MKKKIKKLSRLVIVSMMIISVFILSGCSDKNEMKNTVKNYTKLLNEKNMMNYMKF